MKKIPTIAIIGRPNVGKSSLLNRIIGKRHAIVDPTPGVTRDRNYASAEWNGRKFFVIDTGGLDPENKSSIQKAITEQVDFSLEEADAMILLVDAQTGLHDTDKEILDLLRKRSCGKKIYVAINKLDNPTREDQIYEFYSLGVEKLFPLSAVHGHGVADIMDEIVEQFPRNLSEHGSEEDIPYESRIAIVGKPNVGKSSLFNKLVGQNRSIVDDVAGTTRDSINFTIEREGKLYPFVDTAGLRRPARNKDSVELFSVFRTLETIRRSDIAVIMLDAEAAEITEQDKRIVSNIIDAGSGCAIVWNKWDLPEKTPRLWDEILKKTRQELPLIDFAPAISISAKTGKRVDDLFELLDIIRENGKKRASIQRLNEILFEAVTIQPPPSFQGRALRLSNLRQLDGPGIVFKINCSEPKGLHFSYQRFIMNLIRKEFVFEGWPIRLIVHGTGKANVKK
ncbi:MAG: ribosome biogenesis GTPase Der [Candidatus Riflebacteria bacterium]|nr:ribosome biogenesis GTPase Der [Candidatus Riflebacteria bacterium]